MSKLTPRQREPMRRRSIGKCSVIIFARRHADSVLCQAGLTENTGLDNDRQSFSNARVSAATEQKLHRVSFTLLQGW